MAESPEEGVPLKKKDDEAVAEKANSTNSTEAAGIVLSKVKALLVIVGIVVLIVIIIILAVLLSKEKAKRPIKEGKTDKEGTNKPTIPPTLPQGPWDNIRLPRTIIPSHYDLHLNVDPNKEGFSGKDKIAVAVVNTTSHIIIHSHLINVTKASVSKKGSSGVGIKKQFHVEKTNVLVLETEEPLKGEYILEFEFNGFYRKGLFGLFKGVYRQNTGKTAVFLSTQLQPLDARTIFPCFDEPAFKATFTISLAYPKGMIGLSNNEIDKEEVKDDTKTTYYKKTPIMSTYLVSVVIGDFKSKELKTPSGVMLRAFAQPGNTDQMDFSLRMGNETFTQMENIFGIKYPMKKLNFVAPPECFIAMENWGSIRFEEDGLLYKKDFSSEEIQQNLLIRWLPHEIIHMWFGNLVTMEWWNDLWLNEAVTDFFTYHDGSPKSLDSWKRSEQFVHTNLGYSLGIDGLVNSRPVVEPTNIPNWDTFDNIVYKKGSSLLNMLKNIYPKKEGYIEGMKTYLTRHSFKNAVGSDMWDALQSTCTDKECADFKELMKTWMTETNYPVLTVKKGDGGKYVVHQERFVYDKTAKVDKRMWVLRFSYVKSSNNQSDQKPKTLTNKWMNNPAEQKPLESMVIQWDGRGWIKGNLEQKGFYRVNYEDTTWGHLSHQLEYKHEVFFATDRYGLLDDAFNLARGERVSIKRAMDMTKYINKEREYLPWMAVYKNLQYIVGILPSDSAVNQHLKKYLAYQSQSFYDSLGFKNTGSHLEKLLRKTVVEFQCQSGSKSCLSNMTEMFKKWKKDPLTTSVTPALRSLVYYYGIRHGSIEDWELMLTQLYKNTIASEFQPLLYGLAGSRDIGVLNRYLEVMHNQSIVKQQYLKYVLDDVANHNPVGPDIMWSYIKFNWDKLKGSNPVDAMLQYLQITTQRFSKANQLENLENFINANLNGKPMPRLLRKTLEIVKLNIAWRKAHENDLEQWLQDFFKSKSIPVGNEPGFSNS